MSRQTWSTLATARMKVTTPARRCQESSFWSRPRRACVQDLAVGKFKAAGIISYAQNQKTAWLGDNDNLIRWGHLESFSSNPTFAFQVSLRTARGLKDRLLHGEQIRLHAKG